MKLFNTADAKMKELLNYTRMLRMKHFKTINRLYDGFATAEEFHASNMKLAKAEQKLWEHIRLLAAHNEDTNDRHNERKQ